VPLQAFFREFLPVGVVFVSIGISDVSAGFGHAHATGAFRVRCTLGGVDVRRATEHGPVRGDRASSPSCSKRALAVPPRDGG
jgi:hypothetical protein